MNVSCFNPVPSHVVYSCGATATPVLAARRQRRGAAALAAAALCPAQPRRACRRAERAPAPHPHPLQAGADALAALGVNSALFTFSFVVFNFLATATTPMVASALALGDRQQAGKVTLQALGLASVLGAALAGGLLLGADGALALMGAGPETGRVHELATEFLTIRRAPFCSAGGGGGPCVCLLGVEGVWEGLMDRGVGCAPRHACSRHAGMRLAAPGALKEPGIRGGVDATGCSRAGRP